MNQRKALSRTLEIHWQASTTPAQSGSASRPLLAAHHVRVHSGPRLRMTKTPWDILRSSGAQTTLLKDISITSGLQRRPKADRLSTFSHRTFAKMFVPLYSVLYLSCMLITYYDVCVSVFITNNRISFTIIMRNLFNPAMTLTLRSLAPGNVFSLHQDLVIFEILPPMEEHTEERKKRELAPRCFVSRRNQKKSYSRFSRF